MEWIAMVAGLAVLQVFWFAFNVGVQRARHRIDAPAVTGHPDLERAIRVHMNTVEQLVIFLPGLVTFGYYVHPLVGAGIGVVFIVGRFMYRSGYMKDPKGRFAGFGLSVLAMLVLVVGGIIGAAMRLLA